MTVRRERLKRELRDDILDAARYLFVRQGYESVSMRRIAERCGCALGTLYLHFADKSAILSAICVETFSKLDRTMEAIANDTGDPFERLRRGGRQYIQFGLDHPHHYVITFGSAGGTHMAHDDNAKQAGMNSFECIRRCVRDCHAQGTLRIDDIDAVSQSLWSASHGIVMLLIQKSGFPYVERTRLIDTLLDIFIEGIRAR